MDYLAHKNTEDGREQSILEHLRGTAALSAGFAAAFGAGDEGLRCGMLHDIGKYSAAFQRRINGSPERADHSTAGAYEAAALRDVPAAFCIAGHHGGLPDGGTNADAEDMSTLHGRLCRAQKKKIEDYGAYKTEVETPAAVLPPEFMRTPSKR